MELGHTQGMPGITPVLLCPESKKEVVPWNSESLKKRRSKGPGLRCASMEPPHSKLCCQEQRCPQLYRQKVTRLGVTLCAKQVTPFTMSPFTNSPTKHLPDFAGGEMRFRTVETLARGHSVSTR